MGIFEWMNSTVGVAECTVTGAFPAGFLNCCTSRGIRLLSVRAEDALTLRISLRSRDVERAAAAAERSQCRLSLLSERGAPRVGRLLLRRIVPAACLLCLLFLLVWSKLFIWEIGVTGNTSVSAAKILDGLRECGVGVGTFWPGITSDNLRSELLTEVPELAWATVNIHGSRAEVIVRERVPKPKIFRMNEPMDIVADKTGFITQVQALSGTALVRPGSAVMAGETLISAKAESAFSGTRYVHAHGTVRAETCYELTAVCPAQTQKKCPTGKKTSRWALIIGKNRYNFYRNSSICPEDCDKIISVWKLKISGLLELPVSLVREQTAQYAAADAPRDENLLCRQMEAQLRERLLEEIGPAGVVESEKVNVCEADGCIVACLRARCSESIGTEAPAG